jgi:Bacterial Ig-like domain (group 2)
MTQQYTAKGNYSDASAQDLTGTANWSSGAPGIAGVNATGLAQATAPGTTTVAANVGAVSGNQSLKVSPAGHHYSSPAQRAANGRNEGPHRDGSIRQRRHRDAQRPA